MSQEDGVLEFRDGQKVVPDYLYAELAILDTHLMTYDQAVAEANRRREGRFVEDALAKVQSDHFKTYRRGF